jgi:hypothetical protein
MYYAAIQQFARTLRNLDAILGKAEAHAKLRNFNVDNYVPERLAPDMLPFVKQIQIACDNAKAAAQALSGKEMPKHEDNEATFTELHARIAKCLALLDALTPADFAATKPDTVVKMPNRPGKGMRAAEYLWHRQIPNFYFHVVTAYAILRKSGVEIGKSDYLGPLDMFDL